MQCGLGRLIAFTTPRHKTPQPPIVAHTAKGAAHPREPRGPPRGGHGLEQAREAFQVHLVERAVAVLKAEEEGLAPLELELKT